MIVRWQMGLIEEWETWGYWYGVGREDGEGLTANRHKEHFHRLENWIVVMVVQVLTFIENYCEITAS